MKINKNNLKIIIVFIMGIILASGITAYATVTYFCNATEVKYSEDKTVAQALNELYGSRLIICETGTVTVKLKSVSTNSVTIPLTKTYTEEQKAQLFIYDINLGGHVFPCFVGTGKGDDRTFTKFITGSSISFQIYNDAGAEWGTVPITISYMVVENPNG